MKKIFILFAILMIVAISFNSSAFVADYRVPENLKKAVFLDYLGSSSTGSQVFYFYGDASTGVITSASIYDPNKTWTVTGFQNAKIVNGVCQGRMYATDSNGSDYTFVLTGRTIDLE